MLPSAILLPLAASPLLIAAIVVGVIVALVIFFIVASAFGLWFQALISDAPVGLLDIWGMKFRKVNPSVIIQARIRAVKAGLELSSAQLETYYLNGGRVLNVVDAMIAAKYAGIPLPWEMGCAIDRAGRDILDAVATSVNPKVIEVPNPALGRMTIDAVAKNGIQLKVKAKVTVRTNIKQLVGGATEETIIARVGEGIVTAIGSAEDHKDVLENPDHISKAVLAKGLDANTAFEILSIDIADVDVGENIGAKLQADQAEADKRRFQAEAEKRRAAAVATGQEYEAEVAKARSEVVRAESQIPMAIAEAFRSGNLGIMDYYKLKNIQADTSMRQAIGGEGEAKA